MAKAPVFKYTHPDKISYAFHQKVIISILVIFGIFFLKAYLPLGIFLLVVTLIYLAVIFPRRVISLSPRYLICGNSIFYYKNIDKLVLNQHGGILLIYSKGKLVFRLESELFITNARKIDKIQNNKNNKFKKIADKIINNIINASPDVKLEGIVR